MFEDIKVIFLQIEDVVKADKDELLEYVKKARKDKKPKKKKRANVAPKLTKSEKRKLKLMEKKQRKENDNIDFETRKDEIKFGETVHEPPTLILPRHADKINKKSPGEKELIMKQMLSKKSKGSRLKKAKEVNKVIDRKSKRKLLPVALRRQLELDQKDVMNIYRQLKANKKV